MSSVWDPSIYIDGENLEEQVRRQSEISRVQFQRGKGGRANCLFKSGQEGDWMCEAGVLERGWRH